MICVTCKVDKLLEDFSKNSSSKTGYQLRCKTCVADHYQRNKESIKTRVKQYADRVKADPVLLERLKEVKRATTKRLYWKNPKKFREQAKQLKKENSHYYANLQRARSANLSAQFNRLTVEQKQEVLNLYKRAKELRESTGESWHVDHIIPIKNRSVCGLHVPWNLQVIKAEDNMKKHNTFIAFESEGL